MNDENGIISLYNKEYVRIILENELQKVINMPLILVIAPSGYGKSTFIRHFFEQKEDMYTIWFPMHSDEFDENWIWKRMCQTIGEANKEINNKISELKLPQSKQERAYFINILKKYVKREIYLIVDDYQECQSNVIETLLEETIGSVDKLHILIISRIYPDISYEEKIIKGECAIFNQKNLTLSKEDTKKIFNINNIDLNKDELSSLYKYTDGWISAVYLSLYEYKKNGGFGRFSGVGHLLKSSIFNKLSTKMQEFYMKISLFDFFDISGSNYVTQMQIDESDIFKCQEQFGFIYYDVKTKLFEMHSLLKRVALEELEKSDIDKKDLYNRAGQWSENREIFVKAVRYYIKACNWESIARLYSGEHGRYILEQAPELFEEVRNLIWKPIWDDYIMGLLNYLYFLTQRESAEKVLQLYNQMFENIKNNAKWKDNKKIYGEMMVIRSMLEFNSIEKMNISLKKACEYLKYNTSALLGNSLLTYGTTCMTLLYHNEVGQLKRTIQLEKEYAKSYMHLTKGGLEGWDEFFDAEYAMITGDIDKAYELAGRVCVQNKLRNQTCIVISCYYMMLRCILYHGDVKDFDKKMSELNELIENVNNPVLVIDIELIKGYIYACLGMRDMMPEWIVDFKLENCSRAIRNIRSGCMSYGKLMIFDKNWQMLDMIGEQMSVPYEATSHISVIITANIYKAIAKYNMGYKSIAIDYMQEAINVAEKDNIRIPFIENAADIKPIILSMKKNSFFEKIKPQAIEYEKGVLKILNSKNKANIDVKSDKPLFTKRERELIGYLKQGLKNREISQKMYIAQVTVEKNLTNIYRKLGVANRTSAIAKIEKDGIL